MCVEGLDDAAGTLAFGDHENDRRDGAAVRDMPLNFFFLACSFAGGEISCLCSRRRPSVLEFRHRPLNREEGGRSVAETEPNFLLGGGWLVASGRATLFLSKCKCFLSGYYFFPW